MRETPYFPYEYERTPENERKRLEYLWSRRDTGATLSEGTVREIEWLERRIFGESLTSFSAPSHTRKADR